MFELLKVVNYNKVFIGNFTALHIPSHKLRNVQVIPHLNKVSHNLLPTLPESSNLEKTQMLASEAFPSDKKLFRNKMLRPAGRGSSPYTKSTLLTGSYNVLLWLSKRKKKYLEFSENFLSEA